MERKRRNDEAVLEFMRRKIDEEEQQINEWKTKIAQLREKMEAEKIFGNLQAPSTERVREVSGKLEEDRKAGLKASIAKLKEYINKNQHYLPPL